MQQKHFQRNKKGYIQYPKVEVPLLWMCPECLIKYSRTNSDIVGVLRCLRCKKSFRSYNIVSPNQNDLFSRYQ